MASMAASIARPRRPGPKRFVFHTSRRWRAARTSVPINDWICGSRQADGTTRRHKCRSLDRSRRAQAQRVAETIAAAYRCRASSLQQGIARPSRARRLRAQALAYGARSLGARGPPSALEPKAIVEIRVGLGVSRPAARRASAIPQLALRLIGSGSPPVRTLRARRPIEPETGRGWPRGTRHRRSRSSRSSNMSTRAGRSTCARRSRASKADRLLHRRIAEARRQLGPAEIGPPPVRL